MPFTIRSLFQQGNQDGQPAGATGIMEPPAAQGNNHGALPAPMNSPFGMEVPPASPFGGSLFKTREGEASTAVPVQARTAGGSPFSPAGASQATGLTVADVLPQLPPELAKANSLPPEQLIPIAPGLMDAALSNGRASIPIFEIYRVCPAIFQMPVSPQDPRQVPLPAGKLPALIASSAQNGAVNSSPFAQIATPPVHQAQSPFGSTNPDMQGAAPLQESPMSGRTPAVLPPRREAGVPPPMPMPGASSPFGSAPGIPSQATHAAQSPFGAASPFTTTPPAAEAPSPFSMQGAAAPPAGLQSPMFGTPPPAMPSAFQAAEPSRPAPEPANRESLMNSVFVSSPTPAVAGSPSPFNFPAAAGAQPGPSTPATASPFTPSPFGAPSSPPPFALTEPGPPEQPRPSAPPPFAPSTSAAHASASAAASGSPLKLSLATLLKGYTSMDLGFDPGMVPSWIMTTLPPSAIPNQNASGGVEVELGLLIDGTTDVGFRNVLASARRDTKIHLPANEAIQGPPSTPSAPAPEPEPAPPPFAVQPTQIASPLPPLPTQTPMVPAPVHAAKSQPLNPFATAKAALSGPLQSQAMASPNTGPIQPKPNANFSFSLPPSSAPAAPHDELQVPTRPEASFDPFASIPIPPGSPAPTFPAPARSQAVEGFSSEQLFGAPPPAPESLLPPTLTQPQMPLAQTASAGAPTFTALPGIPLPPDAPSSGARFLTGTALESVPPQASFLPPPVLKPFSGPLRPSSTPTAGMPFFPAPAPMSMPAPLPSALSGPLGSPPPPRPGSMAPMAPPPSLPEQPPVNSSVLGITPVSAGDSEQVMLRALLGVNENLTLDRVVDLISRIPGVAASVCVNGGSIVAHGGSSQSAQDFKRQAGELARSIQALAPLIGIAGAETFSINTSDRLMTFTFHAPIALGVLHQDNDLAAGLRDKITLVGRELARLATKSGGHPA